MSLKDTYYVCRSCTSKVASSPQRKETKSNGHVVVLVLFDSVRKKHSKYLQSLQSTCLACGEFFGV